MKVTRTDHLNRAFVITDVDLGKLDGAFQAFAGQPPKYTAECRDKLTREFGDAAEVSAYENPPDREIISLSIRGLDKDFARSAHLKMSNELPSIWLSVEGPEPDVLALSRAIDERLAGMRPWYSRVASTDFVAAAFVLVGVAYGVLLLASFILILMRTTPPAEVPRSTESAAVVVAIVIFLLPLALGWAFNLLRARYFPTGVFAIGQGGKRHSEKEWVRGTVIVAFLVSLAASVVILPFSR